MITGDHAITASAIAADLGLEGARDAEGRLRAVTGAELGGRRRGHARAARGGRGGVRARRAGAEAPPRARAPGRRPRGRDDGRWRQRRARAQAGRHRRRDGQGGHGRRARGRRDDPRPTTTSRRSPPRSRRGAGSTTTWSSSSRGRCRPTAARAAVLLAAVVTGGELPVLPVQLLWVNMATAVILGISLVFEPKEPGLMDRPPRPMSAPLLSTAIGIRVIVVSLLLAAAAFGFFELRPVRRPEPRAGPDDRDQHDRGGRGRLPVRLPQPALPDLEDRAVHEQLGVGGRGRDAGDPAAVHLRAVHEPDVPHRAAAADLVGVHDRRRGRGADPGRGQEGAVPGAALRSRGEARRCAQVGSASQGVVSGAGCASRWTATRHA